MRRFGYTERFLDLLEPARGLAPEAGARSNVIVGFPGETRADVAELAGFLTAARLDAIGVFGYSDEDGTEAAGLTGKVGTATVRRRVERISRTGRLAVRPARRGPRRHRGRRARRRRSTTATRRGPGRPPGARDRRLHHAARRRLAGDLRVGDLVRAKVTASDGVDLVAEPVEIVSRAAVMTAEPAAAVPAAVGPGRRRHGRARSGIRCVNIANALTTLRVLLVPVFAAARGRVARWTTPGWRIAAALAFGVASVTDYVDGWIARRRNLVTSFGKVADPIADKALIGTALVLLSGVRRGAVVGHRR